MQSRLALVLNVAMLLLILPNSASAGIHCTVNDAEEVAAATAAPTFGPEAPYQVAPSRNFDELHMKLDLDVDLAGRTIAGSVTHTIKALRPDVSRITLDCVDLTVTNVTLPGNSPVKVAEWSQFTALDRHQSGITIVLDPPAKYGQELSLRVEYHGSPTYGLFFIEPEGGTANRRLEAWSQGEGENNRDWIPCFDYPNDKATYEGVFRVAKGQFALSNGVLEKQLDLGDKTEYHWVLDTPQATYLIMLAAAEYEIHRDNWRGNELLYLVPPGTGEETVQRCYGKTPDMLSFFTDTIGIDYPFHKYAQVVVQDFIVGGMENTTSVVMNERSLFDESTQLTRDADSLISHEMAHMWWGDMVTMREWNDIWLNEGFATYFEKLWMQHDLGDDAFRIAMADTHDEVVSRDKRDPTPMVVDFFNRTGGRSNSNPYVKGSSILHMLRHQLGDELFFNVLRTYGNEHKYDFAATSDLMQAVKEVTGENLDWFFEQWVYMAGHPDLTVSKRWDPGTGVLTLNVKQTQKVDGLVPLFRLPIDVEVTTDKAVKQFGLLVSKDDEDFHFKVDGEPKMVIFDKGDWTLKTLNFPKTKAELLYQLEHGDATSQRQAIADLAKYRADADVIAAMQGVVNSDRDYHLRSDAVGIFTEFPDAPRVALLKAALAADDAHVRLKATGVGAMAKGNAEVEQQLRTMLDNDPSCQVRAQCVSSLVSMRSSLAHDACIDALGQESDRWEIRSAGLHGLDTLNSQDDLELIKPYCERGNSRWYRHDAMHVYANLVRRSKDEDVKQGAEKFLVAMLTDSNQRTRQEAISVLEALGEKSAVDELRQFALSEPNGWIADQANAAADRIEARQEPQKSIDDLEAQLKQLGRELEELRRKVDSQVQQ